MISSTPVSERTREDPDPSLRRRQSQSESGSSRVRSDTGVQIENHRRSGIITRVNPLISFLAFIAVAGQLLATGANGSLPPESRPTSQPTTRPATVIVFGDSITEGGALPKDQRDRLWLKLVQHDAEGKLRLINEGKGGRPSASVKEFDDMLRRQPKPELLVIFLGTNDSRDVSGQCVPKAVANLKAMIAAAKKSHGEGLKILLVGPPNLRRDALGPTKPIAEQRDANLHDLGVAYEKLADEIGSAYVSLYGIVPPESLTKDGIHPDAAGNVAIARTMLPAILKALP